MTPKGLTKLDWSALVLSVQQGDCILMLGPEVVLERTEEGPVPLARMFARRLVTDLGEKRELVDEFDCFQVAQVFKNVHGKINLRAAAVEFFQGEREYEASALADLMALPFPLIVTTSPGSEVEDAVAAAPGKTAVSEWYHFEGPVKDAVPEGAVRRPLVYHLYGCLREPSSLVLSEGDLLDFLVSVISKNPDLPANFKSVFDDRDKSCLFVGFGFRHWYLRILLHVLYVRERENRSYALERFDDEAEASAMATTKLFFQEGHRIQFFDMEPGEFAAELRRRVEAAGGGAAAAVVVDPNAPLLFLCHAHEDRRQAAELKDRLEEQGLRVWLDAEDLRGGDRWDPKIETAIAKEVSYVLVLLSQALEAKLEGYVNKEIGLAMERQRRIRDPLVFTIPVSLDGTKPIPELDDLQAIDLTRDGGYERLFTTIRRDRERRRKA